MISPATEHRINSTFGQLSRRKAVIEIHPDDADPRSISEGDLVRAFNELGEVVCAARVTSETRGGVVVLPKGLWSHDTQNGQTSNALAPDELTDIVRVERKAVLAIAAFVGTTRLIDNRVLSA